MHGFRWPHGFAAKEPVSCWSPLNDRQTCAPTTPSTPRATGWIPFCWPGFRCCTPKVYTPQRGLGPGDPLRRATKMHSTLVKRRTTSIARLDALLEILGPDWHAAFSADLTNKTPLQFLAAGYADPHTVCR